jgi:hypothetical protein
MRAHQKLLQMNNWDHIQSEVLVSTPRRFGKTISVSMFAAAMLFSCTACEISIYSTCKRISQKLLRNVLKFLAIINDALKLTKFRVIRENCEEVILNGPDGSQDLRVCNSYPSRVFSQPTPSPHSNGCDAMRPALRVCVGCVPVFRVLAVYPSPTLSLSLPSTWVVFRVLTGQARVLDWTFHGDIFPHRCSHISNHTWKSTCHGRFQQ